MGLQTAWGQGTARTQTQNQTAASQTRPSRWRPLSPRPHWRRCLSSSTRGVATLQRSVLAKATKTLARGPWQAVLLAAQMQVSTAVGAELELRQSLAQKALGAELLLVLAGRSRWKEARLLR